MRHTKEERRQLRQLQEKLNAKEDEISRLIAADLGYGDPAQITDDKRRAALADDVDAVIERWEVDVEVSDNPPTSTEELTPLQATLFERTLISDEIGAINMAAAERFAKRRNL